MNWLIRKSMKIVYWLNVDWFRRTRKSIIDCHFRKFTIIFVDSRCVKWKWNSIIVFKERTFSLTQIHDHFRWFTMRIMKMKCIHRLQRQNFVVSWRFVLLFHSWRRHVSWFFSREFSFRWSEDALCKFHSIHEDSFCCFVIFF